MWHMDITQYGPAGLAEALDKWSRNTLTPSQTPVYLCKDRHSGLTVKSGLGAMFSLQRRLHLYQRIPGYLLDCAAGDTQRITEGKFETNCVELQMRSPQGKKCEALETDVPFTRPIWHDLTTVLARLRQTDLLCLPGTKRAYEAALVASKQCSAFYEGAVKIQYAIHQSGCLSPHNFMNQRKAEETIAQAQKTRDYLLSLPPAAADKLGEFTSLYRRVHEHALRVLENFITVQRHCLFTGVGENFLTEVGLAPGTSVNDWLHQMFQRGRFIYAVESDPHWIRRLTTAYRELCAQHPHENLIQLKRGLAYMLGAGTQLLQRSSTHNSAFYAALNATLLYGEGRWSLDEFERRLPRAVSDLSLLRAYAHACFAELQPSAPPEQEGILVTDADIVAWHATRRYDCRQQLMGQILRRPAVRSIETVDCTHFPLPPYRSWDQEQCAVVQDHIFAGLLIHRLENNGAPRELIEELWNIRQNEGRLSRIVWTYVDRCESSRDLKQIYDELSALEPLLQAPQLSRVRDEVLCCLGGLTQRLLLPPKIKV